MKHTPTDLLHVYFNHYDSQFRLGTLAHKDQQILFEFDARFLETGIQVSPFELPLKTNAQLCKDKVFGGLFGLFYDSMPDGWGQLLLDRSVEKLGIRRGQLTLLDRLAYVGNSGMGALNYEPEKSDVYVDNQQLQLDALAEESRSVLEGTNEEVFQDLLQLNGSSGGARPKIVAQINKSKTQISHGSNNLKDGFEHWMIKFPSSTDASDIGAIEFAFSQMAIDAGILMPETYVYRSTNSNGYFGVKRFDRIGDKRIHMHTLCGLIQADFRQPTLDYEMLLRVTKVLTKNMIEVEKAFRLACFNVLAHNRDDHSKNFSFVLNNTGEWLLSPAYDLTFSDGPSGEHSTMIMGEGKSPSRSNLYELAKVHGLKKPKTSEIIDQVSNAVQNWPRHAMESGVSPRSRRNISNVIVK